MSETKQKFDGYAAKYDEWFMKNDNLFESELRLFKKVLGDISGKKLLSVGCGSGLFESYIDSSNIEGIEPSEDMGQIAIKRGVNVIKFGLIEDVELPDNEYDIIYFNGSSSYMEDLSPVYGKCKKALKEGGKLILLDVPKESAFGFMYLLGKSLNTYDHEYLEGAMPELPYPLALASSGVWHSTEEKIEVLKNLGFGNFTYYQTLVKNPLYTNEEPEEVIEGYKSGGYVAIIAEK
jgi:SAM-dependent methyltransferase